VFPTRILLAADGSEDARRAARYAGELSLKLNSELHVVYVASEYPYVYAYYDMRHREEVNRYRAEDRQTLDRCVERIGEVGGTVAESHLREGDAASEIVELAEELGVGLVVLGSRGRGLLRRGLMGSVSTGVLRHAHCSVLIVRGHEDQREPFLGKLLVAVDGSEEATAAAQAGTEIAGAAGSEIHVAYALQEERYRPHLGPEMWEGWEEGFERAKRDARSWLDGEAKRMRYEGAATPKSHLLMGRPDAAIVWLAEEIGAGLVVVGSRGLGAMRRALIGSVSDSVVRHAHCPVMVVRSEQERTHRQH
jgi:nucleotide-binding universal stress UspA family protein